MNALRHHNTCTLEEYFDIELQSDHRFEFRDGAIVAMSGGSWRHDHIAGGAYAALRSAFRGRCRAFGPNLRIVAGDGTHTYADAGVVCGEQVLSKVRGTDTLHNPALVVEVLSPSTREYDLGDKLDSYQATPSIREILLIEPDVVDVTHIFRVGEGWETRRYDAIEDIVRLVCGERTLALTEIYDLPVE